MMYMPMYEFKVNENLKYNCEERERENKEIEKTILKNMSRLERILYKLGLENLAVRKFRTDTQNIDDLKAQVKGYIKVIRIYKNNKLIHKYISVYKA